MTSLKDWLGGMTGEKVQKIGMTGGRAQSRDDGLDDVYTRIKHEYSSYRVWHVSSNLAAVSDSYKNYDSDSVSCLFNIK